MESINDILKIDPRAAGFTPDTMSQGPMLPAGWNGDSWLRPGDLGQSYCVRAWRIGTTEVILGRRIRFEDACRSLRSQVAVAS